MGSERLEGVKRDTRRLLAVMLVLILVSGAAGIGVGLSVTTLSTQKASLFTSDTAASDFTVHSFDTKVKGTQGIDVDVTLLNDDGSGAAHTANVTVGVVNETDGTVTERTQQTGVVNDGNTVNLKFSFQQADLVDRYDRIDIVVDQTDD